MTMEKGNAVPSITSADSVRIETPTANVAVDRNKVRIIQTPQTFYSNTVKVAFEQDYDELFTDEASVVERSGVKINLVDGDVTNIKITKPIDLVIAEKILAERAIDNVGR
jgi:2-C-methyl-D-erythritol 4-phosphate cytidylyltransferase